MTLFLEMRLENRNVICTHWLGLRNQQSFTKAIEIRGVSVITKEIFRW